MPPKEPKEELDLDEKKAQLAIKFNNAARQFSALAEVLSKAVAEVPIDETTVNSLTELLNAAIAKPSRKRKLVALEIGEDGLPRKRKRERKAKDPNAPKGPASAYILFQNDIRSAYKKEHPDMSNRELLRLIGDQWKTLSDDKKEFYRDQHGMAKKKHEVDLAAYNAKNPDHVPAEAKDSEKKTKKKKEEEESEHPPTKEVAKAAPKATKKAAAPVVPKSKEVVESSGSEAEEASEVEASDAESSDDEPAPKAKAKATTDEDSSDSEVDTSSEEEAPPPPPTKKSRK
ncbi:hypothetical protein DFJ58DRAFT_756044 [Suillus subalutaceus]|uniref:uncharacterized protein n=1 Tax=Suillus subalutaceus TaxID=48586 RepID=UPI001B870747|nr:uncharacterized protein DFJ58DRAFT_756044 [Suillus subalutaceus]KAG1875373.1 hypothetical protein DFJ58DRAFT_756044 [Suillus subalutaceus]